MNLCLNLFLVINVATDVNLSVLIMCDILVMLFKILNYLPSCQTRSIDHGIELYNK